ncbi:MAG TPA: glycosyltransferase, partial [Magnetospirillum sp.]|nr:glycosyltransferase [Magnetospirillum sp.]
RPDLLLTYNWGSMEWALANLPHLAPHVHVEDGFGPDEASGQLFRRVMFRRLVLAWGSVVVLPSRTLCAIAAEQWRLNPGRLRYIPNGIDLERFGRPCTEGEDLRRRPGEVLVGTVAALRPEKNLGRLIEAFAQVPPAISARLVIVGGGPERERLEATVRRLRLEDNVLLLGPMAAPERVLSQLDIFALSSDTEQMPVSLIEAMASGLPVAACDVGDVRRMLPQDNWPYVVPPDAARLAESLRVLACTPDLRRRLGQANRAHAIASYDQAGMVAAWGRLLDERMSP